MPIAVMLRKFIAAARVLIIFGKLNRQIEATHINEAQDSSLKSAEFSRILLIKPSALGDVVHTIPVLVKLRARYPRARIDWLITPENAEVVRHHPALSNVVLFARRDFSNPGQKWRATLGFFDLLKQIRSAKYDLVVDMHGQVRSALFALISGARVRIGFDRPIRFSRTISAEHDLKNVPNHGWRGAREGSWIAYTHRIPIPTLDVHATARCSCARDNLGNKALDHRRICRRRARVSWRRICRCSRRHETR